MSSIGQIFPLKPDQIQKYGADAMKLCLEKDQKQLKELSKAQKIIVSKIYRNLNILCKLTKKELKELFKQSKQYLAYQTILGELFFQSKINNYVLINKEQSNVKIQLQTLRISNQTYNSNAYRHYKPVKCLSVDYRLQFTISNINKKKVMKPVVLIIYRLQDLSEIKIYYSIQQFSNLRYEVAQNVKKMYGIQLRTMF